MNLVIDANILFSALIKNSLTAELIFNQELRLYTCEFIIEEFFKYETEILLKTHRTEGQWITIMHQLREIITVIPKEEYSQFMDEAEKLCPDPKDAIYFALALRLGCPIWSNDKRLKDQESIRIYSTAELKDIVYI
ncbi:PIN domain-containing protein [Candidatus Woesearchaeota archaeon]|nr:PIN domain-containing protein [Candidatus Woesearchaeota archaeon]